MTNLERLKMEIEGIAFDDNKLNVYLQENELNATVEYAPIWPTMHETIKKV